jgi:putative DNA primase/helicase
MHFNGQVWEEVKSIFNIIRAAAENIRDAYRKKSLEDENWKKNIDSGFAGLDSLLTQNFVYLVIKNLESDTTMYRKESDFDKDTHLLNTPGVIVDLRTGDTFANRPDYLCRQMASVVPLNDENGAKCPYYMSHLRFMSEGKQDIMNYLEGLSGYMLTGETSLQQFYWMFGLQNNGKSTLVNIWGHILGGIEPTSYFWEAAQDLFAKTNHTAHPEGMLRLMGKRMILIDELDGHSWNEAKLKGFTSGSPVAAREMRGSTINFMPQGKLIFTSNHKPAVNANDGGIARRMHLMDFVKQITPDMKLDKFEERFLQPEAPYILNRMITAAKQILATGKLELPAKFRDATTEYFGDNNLIAQFVEDCCDTGEFYSEPYKNLFKSYSAWSKENEYDAMSSKKFGDLLRDLGYKAIRTTSLRSRTGIQLKDKWKPDALKVDMEWQTRN